MWAKNNHQKLGNNWLLRHNNDIYLNFRFGDPRSRNRLLMICLFFTEKNPVFIIIVDNVLMTPHSHTHTQKQRNHYDVFLFFLYNCEIYNIFSISVSWALKVRNKQTQKKYYIEKKMCLIDQLGRVVVLFFWAGVVWVFERWCKPYLVRTHRCDKIIKRV